MDKLSSLQVRQFMTEVSATVRPDASILGTIDLFLRDGKAGAAVVDDEGQVVGVLSVRDCLKYLVAAHYENMPLGAVRNYMSREVRTVTPDTSLLEVATGFIDSNVRCLPVMEDGRLVGQINRIEVLRAVSLSA